MKNNRIRDMLKGALMASLVFLLVLPAVADLTGMNITVYPGIKIMIDEKEFVPKDANGDEVQPFVYNGTTFVPIRAISQAFGKEVSYNQRTNTAYIGKQPVLPDVIQGVVQDSMTGEPVAGATVTCSAAVSPKEVQTDANGAFLFEGTAIGDFTVTVAKAGYATGSPVTGTCVNGTAKVSVPLRPDYAEVYKQFLLKNQELPGGLGYYDRGKGRFALAKVSGDEIPELFYFGQEGYGFMVTCYNGKVTDLMWEDGNTDITYVEPDSFCIQNSADTIITHDTARSRWQVYTRKTDEPFTYVLTLRLFEEDGRYYCNQYDPTRMINESIDYVLDFTDHEVSRQEYMQILDRNGLKDENFRKFTDADMHPITPAGIQEVFG